MNNNNSLFMCLLVSMIECWIDNNNRTKEVENVSFALEENFVC